MERVIADKIRKFFAPYPVREYQSGEILVFGGENPDAVMYILEGTVIQYDVSAQGEKIIINVFKPPAFFPMSWALNKTPNSYFFEAKSKVRIQKAPPAEVITFLQNNSDVAIDLLARVYSGVDGILRRTVHMMGGNATSLLLNELITSCYRFGKSNTSDSYLLLITEHELANRTGIARETVSRELKKLKLQKLIRQSRGKIEIPNIRALKNLLDDYS